MAQNREAMADLVAILDARGADYARAQAELDTSGDTVEHSCWRNCCGSQGVWPSSPPSAAPDESRHE